ncbi:hypothetical protein LRS11_03270 [Pseudomonas sp. J452]|uniref:hypothetical protein n=1 Tax=Pseudomonas sp. J452 TaxID=2898441 RepID=UPI0021ADAEED|nr:hypothetical protein [Pseudomonas sp. J452]UUY09069.1 hypothetical protein LRS11_03270 [Pseudomonas sp. J452]
MAHFFRFMTHCFYRFTHEVGEAGDSYRIVSGCVAPGSAIAGSSAPQVRLIEEFGDERVIEAGDAHA